MKKEYQNYYELLEIPENATRKEIIQAYQRAKAVYSNDSMALYTLYSNEDSNYILNAIEDAYRILTISEKREKYDQENNLNQSNSTVRISYDKPGYMKRTLLDIPSFLNEEVNVVGSKKYILKSNENKKADVGFKVEVPLFETDENIENMIKNETEFRGSFLKEVREYKNISYSFISSKTKISSFFIKCIEDESFEHLPARVYLKGFVKNIIQILGLPIEKACESYMKRYDKQFKN